MNILLLLMAAASALTTRRVLLLASTSDNARRLLNDLDEASSRLDAALEKTLPTDLPSKFNVTAGRRSGPGSINGRATAGTARPASGAGWKATRRCSA